MMSAFIVSMDTINKVVDLWVALRTELRDSEDFVVQQECDRFGRELLAMNVSAVSQRYPDCKARNVPLPGEPEGFAPETYVHEPAYYFRPGVRDQFCNMSDRMRAILVACIKAAQCLRYQSSEGDVPRACPTYQVLDGLIGSASELMVNDAPEYAAARWD
jgi:hypothetical protein